MPLTLWLLRKKEKKKGLFEMMMILESREEQKQTYNNMSFCLAPAVLWDGGPLAAWPALWEVVHRNSSHVTRLSAVFPGPSLSETFEFLWYRVTLPNKVAAQMQPASSSYTTYSSGLFLLPSQEAGVCFLLLHNEHRFPLTMGQTNVALSSFWSSLGIL